MDARVNLPNGVFITAYGMHRRVTYCNNENKTPMPIIVAMVPVKAMNSVNKMKAARLRE